MKWILMLSVALIGLGCKENSTPQNPERGTMDRPESWPAAVSNKPREPISASTAAPTSPNTNNKPAKRERDKTPVPPKDAQFTLYCEDFTGPSHVMLANRSKSELISGTGLKNFYIVHQEDHSTLFYGYYREAGDAAAQRDRAALTGLRDKFGNPTFKSVIVMPVDAPDPVAPPEWNLANLRTGEDDTKHYWTIQIAAYQGSPERKQVAVEAVKDARQRGIEAYFFHGPTISSVCIGCWSKEAIRTEGADDKYGVRLEHADQDQQLLVAPGIQFDDKMKRQYMQKNVEPRQPKVSIVDQSMIDMKERYPEHAVNGQVMLLVDQDGVKRPRPSLVVQVPVKANQGLAGRMGQPVPGVEPAAPPPPEVKSQLTPDSRSSGPGTGRLKSVGK